LTDKVLLPRYPEIDPALIDVTLIDSGDRVLGGWHSAAADSAERQPARLGVRVLTSSSRVGDRNRLGTLEGRDRISARTTCWCATRARLEAAAAHVEESVQVPAPPKRSRNTASHMLSP
jgi:hypothetical protein